MPALHPRIDEHLTRVGIKSQVTVNTDKQSTITGNLTWSQIMELERAVAQHDAGLQLVSGALCIVQQH